jgi:hypothetical protein
MTLTFARTRTTQLVARHAATGRERVLLIGPCSWAVGVDFEELPLRAAVLHSAPIYVQLGPRRIDAITAPTATLPTVARATVAGSRD